MSTRQAGRRRSATARPSREPALPANGRHRVIIDAVRPGIDAGRFPIKRIVGESVEVEADVFADGHDVLRCLLRFRHADTAGWQETPMDDRGNDRWVGCFAASELGRYYYTVCAWIDRVATWQRDLQRKFDAGQDVGIEFAIGARLLAKVAVRANREDAERLAEIARQLGDVDDAKRLMALATGDEVGVLNERYPDRFLASEYPRELEVVVDRERARFSAWYELFPRSCSAESGRHGTLADVEARLPYVADMGFDTLYLPPIHPIGKTKRKGKNNAIHASDEDIGSPWAIGDEQGGHRAIHPQLGTVDDLERLVAAARDHGIEVALDLAYQCSPDHPWVKEHPEWFGWRPDGTVQFAENPPKRYEDIFPLEFDSDAWPELWRELRAVVEHWIAHGIRIFRVDNPHTKPFAFWEWLIDAVKREHPDVIFLAEAFTRPKIMRRLAKLGFTQSYTYFAWRNTGWELTEYFTELTQTDAVDYFRPNAWPNTPDILTEYLQLGGRPAFVIRLVLAATLTASYGIYGPAFELGECTPREPGSEEYLDSEKYQIRDWNLEHPGSLAPLISTVNRIRRENTALQQDRTLRFHPTDNEALLCYSKTSADGDNTIVCVVNLDPHHRQFGWVDLQLDALGLGLEPYQVHDLLGGSRFIWQGSRNYVELAPDVVPAHVFAVRRRVRTEQDFDYYV